MKHIYLILILWLIIQSNAYCEPDNWNFSINLGGSWPVGEFANKSATDMKAGYAQKGFSFSIDASYPVSNYFSLKGTVFLNNNQVNRLGMYNQLVDRMEKYFSVTNQDQEFISLSVNPWVWNEILVGPLYTIAIGKAYWDFQILGGLNIAYLPQQKFLYQNPANNWLYLHHNLNSVSVSYGILGGTALRLPVSDKVYLRLGIDYYNSQATTRYEEIKVTNEGTVTHIDQLNKGKSNVPIQNISGTIGFVYYLN